jgi:hypothetical protein
MAQQEQQEKENGSTGFVDSLREIQGEYIMLGELYEKQKSYGSKLSELMRTLQYEVDSTIPIRPAAIGQACRAAYLVSEAVVVVFDMNGAMTSKPLYTMPPNVIISIIEECTPELRRLISEKRVAESGKVKSMERVLKELKKAQATFKQMKRDELEGEDEEPKEEMPSPRPEEQQGRKEAPQQTPQQRGRDSFAFRGSFGNSKELSTISS